MNYEMLTDEEVCYTPKELYNFFQCIQQKSGDYLWKWILKMWNNDERNINLHEAKCIAMIYLRIY